MLHWLDWTIIGAFLLLSLLIGLKYRAAAGKSLGSFFLGGRNLPWYVAGLSMVATTFAADTPLAVSELVSQGGIAKNWLWWSFMFGGALTTFFFAALWRRSGVLTELEFITLRYSGRPARLLRMFKSVYLGLIINALIIAWVNLAMISLLEVFFDLETATATWLCVGLMVVAMIYSTLSGLKGIAITDAVQFVIAMIGCIVLAVLVIGSEEIGGITALKAKLPATALEFMPSISLESGRDTAHGLFHGFGLTIGAFLSFVAVQWWASWYPGSEPGGGGYVAQRMMSTRSEKDAIWATLLFQIGHYCVRPWPWVLVGLCAIALYAPELNSNDTLQSALNEAHALAQKNDVALSQDAFLEVHPEFATPEYTDQVQYHFKPRLGFVFAMRDFLPIGLKGLLLTAFMAAYLSTISTQVNWGASYLINDLFVPIVGESSSVNLVALSRWASILVMLVGASVTPFVNSISAVWEFIMQCGAGLGLVLILRWYWWRINAWSEIAATVAPLLAYALYYFVLSDLFPRSFEENNGPFYFTVLITTITWLVVTFLTRPESTQTIAQFCERVAPMGIWPAEVASETSDNRALTNLTFGWALMSATILFTLFTIGSLVLAEWWAFLIYLLLALLSALGLRKILKKTNIFGRNSIIE